MQTYIDSRSPLGEISEQRSKVPLTCFGCFGPNIVHPNVPCAWFCTVGVRFAEVVSTFIAPQANCETNSCNVVCGSNKYAEEASSEQQCNMTHVHKTIEFNFNPVFGRSICFGAI